jgi:6-phosphofructokinase 1
MGFLEGAGPGEVLGVVGGPAGLLGGERRLLKGPSEAHGAKRADRVTLMDPTASSQPGALLGAGRYPFTGADLDAIGELLAAAGIDGLGLIGGNGTMFVAQELHDRAARSGTGLSVVGVPKTVDNDLLGTDHAPGFPSAARFLIQAVRDLDLDHRAMQSIEQVRIVETLGRSTGWLALSTLAARSATGGSPHLVYVPERPFSQDSFLDDVRDAVASHGRAFVVVAEGLTTSLPSPFDQPVYDRPISGGVGQSLAKLVEHRLGYGARCEVLGLIQRCASWAVSTVDSDEAYALGREGSRLLSEGVSGVMVALAERLQSEAPTSRVPTTVPLAQVAGRTRPVSAGWVPHPSGAAEEFVAWLKPLLG